MCCDPRRTEEKNMCGAVATSKGGVHGWYRWDDTPKSLGHIFVSWLRLVSVPASFSPYPALRDTNGSVGSTRGPFS